VKRLFMSYFTERAHPNRAHSFFSHTLDFYSTYPLPDVQRYFVHLFAQHVANKA
jgi:hypothetical protein